MKTNMEQANRPGPKLSEEEIRHAIKVFEDAFAEFNRDGKVTTVRCHKCNGLIHIEALSPTAWQTRCPCGFHNDTLRGL